MTLQARAGDTRRPLRLLVLGGTSEASALARAVATRDDIDPLLSLAGRTTSPSLPPIPYRIGGFGGIEGLATFLRESAIDAVVDATHPFAARISANAVAACGLAGVSLAGFTRPPWQARADDLWTVVPDIGSAVAALRQLVPDPRTHAPAAEACRDRTGGPAGLAPTGTCASAETRPSLAQALRDRLAQTSRAGDALRVFVTTGRLDIDRFRAAPGHHYLIRTIDRPDAADLPPGATVILARPPFEVEGEVRLMQAHGTDLLVTKNSGGAAAAAKLAAARRLGIPVLMIDRPPSAGALRLQDLDATLAWLSALTRIGR